jgi:hypothetical protein
MAEAQKENFNEQQKRAFRPLTYIATKAGLQSVRSQGHVQFQF